MMVRDTSFENVCLVKLGLKFLSKRSMQLGFFKFLKQVESICKGEASLNIPKHPLLQMLSTRAVNHKINRLHERGFRALLNDGTSTFNDMLLKSNDTTIHIKNIQ